MGQFTDRLVEEITAELDSLGQRAEACEATDSENVSLLEVRRRVA